MTHGGPHPRNPGGDGSGDPPNIFDVFTSQQIRVLGIIASVGTSAAWTLYFLATRPGDFIVATLLTNIPEQTEQLLRDPLGTIYGAIVSFFLTFIILPILNGILWLALTILDGLVFLVFGSDQVVGPVGGTFPGFADLLFLLVGVIGQPFGVGADLVVGFFGSVQSGLTAATQPLGPLAPVVLAAAGTFMLAGGFYLLGKAFESVDIPLINKGALVDVFTFPFRALLRLFGFGGGG